MAFGLVVLMQRWGFFGKQKGEDV